MSEAWVKDLCIQWNAVASIGKKSNVNTSDGKVRVDHSMTGRWYRSLWNSTNESRETALQGILDLCERTNDYVASVFHVDRLQPNVFGDGKMITGSPDTPLTAMMESVYLQKPTQTPKKEAEKSSSGEGTKSEDDISEEEKDTNEKMIQQTQTVFFTSCDERTKELLSKLAQAINEGYGGMSILVNKRYATDYETVALLFLRMNYAQLLYDCIIHGLEKNM